MTWLLSLMTLARSEELRVVVAVLAWRCAWGGDCYSPVLSWGAHTVSADPCLYAAFLFAEPLASFLGAFRYYR